MNLWVLFALMTLAAIAFIAWPLYRTENRLTPVLALAVVGITALSAGLYHRQGQPDVPSGPALLPASEHAADDAIAGLAERLRNNPDDIDGWIMLGRSYAALGNSAESNDAFERALEVAPDDPQALYFGGLVAYNRNDLALAADRWEQLLELNPPPEIQEQLRENIAMWRGQSAPVADSVLSERAVPVVPDAAPEGAVVSIGVSLSDAAQSAISGNPGVFIIARDPAAPSPPIAVILRHLTDLPDVVNLGDGESMVAGRNLSGFEQFEVVARVSISGQPSQQSGDWFGSVIVTPAEDNTVNLTISEQVP